MLQRFYANFAGWVIAAKEDGPEISRAQQLLEAIPIEKITWAEPEKRGKRTYDDKKFVVSLQKQLDKGKRFSERQWFALIQRCIKYADQLPGLEDKLDTETRKEFTDVRRQAEAKASEKPEETTVKMLDILAGISQWEEPVTRGKRTYDDNKFYNSLKDQAEGGRKLTPNQAKALKRIVAKYHKQIDNFEALSAELDLPKAKAAAEVDPATVNAVFAMADEIKEWAPPTGKGRRKFDDKVFIADVSGRYAESPRLTDRQWVAVKKVIAKYGEQIENYAERAAVLGMPPAGGRDTGEPTNVTCPKCSNGKLNKRSYRRRTFYGCDKYPACDFTTNDLNNLEVSEKK